MPRSNPRRAAVKATGALAESDLSDVDDDSLPQDEEEEQEQQVEDASGEAAPAPKKKARTSTGKAGNAKRKVKGSLKGILDLPLETVALISSNLDLATVFHLSRLNKRFWRFLRDPAVEYIWEEARKTSALPEMREPFSSVYQYANLLFGCCKGCGKATVMVDYILRIHQGVRQRKLDAFLIQDLHFVTCLLGEYRSNYSDAKEVSADLAFIKFAGWDAIRSEQDLNAFVGDCMLLGQRQYNDGLALIDWQKTCIKEKERDLEAARIRRRKAIQDRLTELGWAAHHLNNPELLDHPQVNVARDLTESAWSKMKVSLEALLAAQKTQRDAKLIGEVLYRRRRRLQDALDALRKQGVVALKKQGVWPLPESHTFDKAPAFLSLYETKTVESAEAPDPSLDRFVETLAAELVSRRAAFRTEMFRRLVQSWESVQKELAKKAARPPPPTETSAAPSINPFAGVLSAPAASSAPSPSSTTVEPSAQNASPPSLVPVPPDGAAFSPSETRAILSRATALVRCRSCWHLDTASRIAGHTCSRSYEIDTLKTGMYTVDSDLVKAVLEVVELAGQEVDVAAEAMDALDPGYCCTLPACAGAKGTAFAARTGISWRRMVEHIYQPQDPYCWGQELVEHAIVFEDRQTIMQRLYDNHLETSEAADARKRGDWPYEDEE
ncbi:hypothetical protein JCM6882_002358 [Rhodosporidiobolus microsporus]